MQAESAATNFEAAALRDTLLHLRRVVRERIQSRKTLDIKQSEAALGLVDIQMELELPTLPKVIECFDISNISGTPAPSGQHGLLCGRAAAAQPTRTPDQDRGGQRRSAHDGGSHPPPLQPRVGGKAGPLPTWCWWTAASRSCSPPGRS